MTWIAMALRALGSMARHGVNHVVHVRGPARPFPLETLTVVGLHRRCKTGAARA